MNERWLSDKSGISYHRAGRGERGHLLCGPREVSAGVKRSLLSLGPVGVGLRQEGAGQWEGLGCRSRCLLDRYVHVCAYRAGAGPCWEGSRP